MPDWPSPDKPAELAEDRLIQAICDGSFPINSNLPPERDLAQQLGITRPTLREALQRLSRDGWIEIHHGRSTRVKNFWKEGNLLILNAMAKSGKPLPPDFIPDLLAVRTKIAPAYFQQAFQNDKSTFLVLLSSLESLPDTAEAFAKADSHLHFEMASLSGNRIYPLLLNSFQGLIEAAGLLYFQMPSGRETSARFYRALKEAALQGDNKKIETITLETMQLSSLIWQHLSKEK